MKRKIKPYDCVIVLGKNWEKYPNKTPAVTLKNGGAKIELSIESKMSALAAGEMYREGLVQKILFSTGHTAGQNFPSEAEEMKGFMKKKFPKIPNHDIVLEEKSFDTPTNAKEVRKIIKKHNFKKIALLTTKAHMLRANALFRNFGVKVDDFYSEEETKKISKHYYKFVQDYSQSKRARVEELKELLLRQFAILDPQGKFLGKITKRIRHQAIPAAWSVKKQGELNQIFLTFI